MPVSWSGISGLDGVVGQPYGKILYVFSGTPPYTLTQQSGTFPPGLGIAAFVPPQYINGQFNLSGTPTTPGVYSSVWRATDSLGAFTDATIAITVTAVQARSMLIPPPMLAKPYVFSLTDDFAISALVAAGYGAGSLTRPFLYGVPVSAFGDALSDWALSFGLIAGVATFSSTAVILGTVHGGIGSIFEVPVTDSSMPPKTAGSFLSFIAFDAPLLVPPFVSCGSPPVGIVGTPYSHTFPASGGTPPYTFSLADDPGGVAMLAALGMTLNSATGILSGTPPQIIIYFFIVQITDSASVTSQVHCSISTYPPVAISCGSPPSGITGVPYTHSFPAVYGLGPYTFSISSGALPDGISLDTSTGVASGIPTAPGPFSFTVSVSDNPSLYPPPPGWSAPSVPQTTAHVGCSIAIAGAPEPPPVVSTGDVLTARIFQGGGTAPTKMRLSGTDSGLTATGDRSLRLSPQRDSTHTI